MVGTGAVCRPHMRGRIADRLDAVRSSILPNLHAYRPTPLIFVHRRPRIATKALRDSFHITGKTRTSLISFFTLNQSPSAESLTATPWKIFPMAPIPVSTPPTIVVPTSGGAAFIAAPCKVANQLPFGTTAPKKTDWAHAAAEPVNAPSLHICHDLAERT